MNPRNTAARLLLWLGALLLPAGGATRLAGQADSLFVSAAFTPPGAFTQGIEGPACDAAGLLYAVNYGRTCYVTLADRGNIETFRTDRPGRSWQLYQQRQTPVAPSAWGQVKRQGGGRP